MKRLAGQVNTFVKSLRHDYAREIARDARAFKRSVVELVRRGLPPGAGHPRNEAITRAVEMRARSKPWLEVYRQCIPAFSSLGEGLREIAMNRLRAAVRSRRVRQQRQSLPKPRKSAPQDAPGCTISINVIDQHGRFASPKREEMPFGDRHAKEILG
ncbi:MAG TPA: hypothetical protein VG206_09020 [Terriglobia bacterium]|nr:hypothetical protein [Terriglobia bacterium]